MKRIYLDNNATTLPDSRLKERFIAHTFETYGNPSSIHFFGQEAKALLIKARENIANIFGVRSNEILFTASATEALNLILRGLNPRGHVISSNVEHSAVDLTLKALSGIDVTYLEVGAYGAPTKEMLIEAIRPDTSLITLMAVNNETGVVTDINAIAEVAYEKKIPLVVDGVALLGKEKFLLHPGISAITFSGHKFYAPKGSSFSIIRKGLKLTPYLTGGHQEYGLRAGTENLAAICALSDAVSYITEDLDQYLEPMRSLRDYFEQELKKRIPNITINGQGTRCANTSNVCFHGKEGEALLMYLDLHGVAASLGSACSSGSLEPSRVLLNMGLSRDDALSSLRFSLGRNTTTEEIDEVLRILMSY